MTERVGLIDRTDRSDSSWRGWAAWNDRFPSSWNTGSEDAAKVLGSSKRQVRPSRRLPDRRVHAIPGPRGHFLFGSLLDIQRDPLTFLSHAQRLYGDVVHARLGPKSVY